MVEYERKSHVLHHKKTEKDLNETLRQDYRKERVKSWTSVTFEVGQNNKIKMLLIFPTW